MRILDLNDYRRVGIDCIDLSRNASVGLDIRFISDTHGRHDNIIAVETDVVVHCGDEANARDAARNSAEAEQFFDWYAKYPAAIKIYVPGNHSLAVYNKMITVESLRARGITALVDQPFTFNGYKFYGSPWTPTFGSCCAYMTKRGRMDNVWSQIPIDTDVLLTHGPPQGIMDLAPDYVGGNTNNIVQVGCSSLMRHALRVNPLIHAFGHIHEISDYMLNYGVLVRSGIAFINASCCDLRGAFINQGIVARLPSSNPRPH